MSAVRALLQSMPPLFGPESDLDEHLRDLEAGAEGTPLEALLLASVEDSLLLPIAKMAGLPTRKTISEVLRAADTAIAEESRRRLASTPTDNTVPTVALGEAAPATAAIIVAEPVNPGSPIEQVVDLALPANMDTGSIPVDELDEQLTTHRFELSSVDQKLALIDHDIDQIKTRVAEISHTMKLRLAQRTCLIGLRKAHTQFISRCAKTA